MRKSRPCDFVVANPLTTDTPPLALRPLAPGDRIGAVADHGSVANVDESLSAPRPSPHLARWKIKAQADDGVVLARATIFGAPVLIAAQDERFLGGSAGANHADALRRLFECAREERPAAVLLLLASGGVRLYEANPAEHALARALTTLLDLRAAGIRVLTLGVGDVFGGSSVLACATDRVAFLPGTKLGLSGPKLIEMAHGRRLDAADVPAVAALFGAEARAAKGEIELVADDAAIVRAWIASTLRDEVTFVERVQAMQVHLAKRLFASDVRRDTADARRVPAAVPAEGLFADARPVAPDASLWKVNERPIWLARPSAPRPVGPREAHALDADLLAHLASEASSAGATLILVEDSPGHEATAAAEALCVSQYLAQHAAVLALLRARGVRIVGLLTGSGHSAAFSPTRCKPHVSTPSRTPAWWRWSPPPSRASRTSNQRKSRRSSKTTGVGAPGPSLRRFWRDSGDLAGDGRREVARACASGRMKRGAWAP
jgi:malonate decarboxylase beta subunit